MIIHNYQVCINHAFVSCQSDMLVIQGQFLTNETAQLVKDADDIEVKVTNVKREADGKCFCT